MRSLIATILLLVTSVSTYSQNVIAPISIEFSNINRVSALQKIEANSNYKFYYQENWFDNNILISGKYTNKTITEILTKVLEDTELNFFIDNNKVILIKNSIIYENFPEFETKTESIATKSTKKSVNPLFFGQFDSIKNSGSKKENNKIVLLGKESLDSNSEKYLLSGYLKDIKNGEPLADITIKIKNTPISTITNAEGYYKLLIPAGMNIIDIESLIYKNMRRKIMSYGDGKLNLFLSEKLNQLDEVIVSNKSQNIRTAIIGVTTIEAEGIKNIPLVLGERDVLKVALTIPGIKTAGEGSSGFNVRGGKEDQNLILLDNATIYNPMHFFGFFSAINPYTINKVEIYKGGIPPEFGGRLSSVFDITSKKGDPDKLVGEGGIGPVTSNLTVSTPIVKGKSSLLVGGRATYSDWLLKKLDNEELSKSQASFYDLFAKYSHKINTNNTIEGTAYFSKDSYTISSDSLYKFSNRLASLKWKHTFNEKNNGDLIITNSEYKFNIDYNTILNPNSFDFGYKINETQAILKMNTLINQNHRLVYGISSKLYAVNPGELIPKDSNSSLLPITIPKEQGLESAFFISDSYKVSEKLLLDLGVRLSTFSALGESTQIIYQEGVPLNPGTVVGEKEYGKNEVIKTYSGFEPRLGARYLINETFSIKAGYDQTVQYIHLLSNNTTQSPTDTWKLSNLNIAPQQAQQLSLGLFKKTDYQDLELSVEGYYKKSKNILDYKVAADLLLNETLETELLQGEGKAYGIEFLVKKSEGRLNGWIGYTYSRALIKLDGEYSEEKVNNGNYFPTNYDKPHDFSTVLNYKFTHRYSFSANFIYQTGRPITYPIGQYNYGNAEYTLYSDRNKFRIPDYYRLDIGFNIEGSHKIKKLTHSFWNISIYNVLGRNNPYSVFFVTKEGKIQAYQTSIFSIPIPTITYNFKF